MSLALANAIKLVAALNKPISLMVYWPNTIGHVAIQTNFLTRQYSNIVHDISELETDTFKLLFQSMYNTQDKNQWYHNKPRKHMISTLVEVNQIIMQMKDKSTELQIKSM